MGLNSTYVFDIDGVLLDVSQRIVLAEKASHGNTSLFWQYFFSEEFLQFDRPRKIGIDILLDRMCRGIIIIVTGRPSRLRRATLYQLQSIGIPINGIREMYMRPNNDHRKSYLFKLETIEKILLKGYTILELHDDDDEFLKRVRKILIHTKLYLHSDNNIIELSNKFKPLW